MPLRLTTWNLQGRERPDAAAVADVLSDLDADVVLLQEVQRRQATAIARHLGWVDVRWRLKHWPVVHPAEGLAVLARHRITHDDVVVLARRWALWSSHRRIALVADLLVDGAAVRVVDTHLGAGVGDAERARQAAVVTDLVDGAGPSVIAGDLNARPGSAVIDRIRAHGHVDAWTSRHGDEPGHTNWSAGPRDGAPTKRLDYVLVDPVITVVDADVPRHGDQDFARYPALSDHLPVTATLALG